MKATYVPPSGNFNAKLAVCGEQPGFQEVRARKPFIGPAGQGLDECLIMAKIARSEVYMTNVIKDLDKPLKAYIDLDTRGRFTISKEGYAYIQELGEEIKKLNLNVIIALGNIALIALTNRVGITKWRGSVIESTLVPGLKVVPTFHPATFIPPKFNFLNKPLIVEDLIKSKKESTFSELRRVGRTIHIKPTFNEAKSTLEYCYELGLRGQTIDIDIEVINGLDCFSVAWSPYEGMSIPLRGPQGDYFNLDQEYEILLLLAKLIQEERISKRGANFIFDTQLLFHYYGMVPRGELHCTQIAQKIAFPDFPAGLDFVTTMHTDIPYYKADGKQWIKMGVGSWEEWWNYSGLDAVATAAANPRQIEVLERQGNIETYNRQRGLIKPLIYMAERGIKVDVDGMLKYKEIEQANLDKFAEELNVEVGYEINYNSPQQLMQYFYKELGLQPYKKKNAQGKFVETTDVTALKRLARRDIKAAQLMLDIRSLSKRISTYLDIGKVDKDGRYRSSYKPVGAETGRLSSGETIFGTGGNQQNWPHDLLRFFLFDEGYIGYSFDLSQIENRLVAYVGGVIPQIEAFEKGIDLHRLTASVIFNKPYDQVSAEDGSSDLGDGRQSERFWGKKCLLSTSQVLTPHGWFFIGTARHYNLQIAQWDIDGTISFTYPSEWFEDIYSGEIITIENQRIFHEATPDHKMPLKYMNTVISKKLSDYPHSGKYRSPLSGIYSGDSNIPDPLVRFIVAFQADGYWNGNGINFNLSKPRKINRIKDILELANISYTDNPSGIHISAKHDLCKFVDLMIGRKKLFGEWLLNLDQQSLQVFVDELSYWDGSIEGTKRYYFTTIKQNAEWVQTIVHLCGLASNIIIQDNSKTDSFGNRLLYRVNIRESDSPATSAIKRSSRQVSNEKIFCPTVPSGYFLTRQKGKISITGNSNHAINYDISYVKFGLINEVTESEAKFMLERVHSGYPQIKGGYHELIQRMLKENRTVTNLFGRKRLFLGPVIPSYPNSPKSACQETYRQAYAHLPQSTTADKINEQGLEYIYYNQDLFKPIELLAQVHDSIVFQVPLSIPWIEHAKMLIKIKQSLEQPLFWHSTKIPTPSDLSIGYCMCKEEMAEVKHTKFPSAEEDLAKLIETEWNELMLIKKGYCYD